MLPNFWILRESAAFQLGKHFFAVHGYFEAAAVSWNENQPFDFTFEFSDELFGQTDRLRFVISSLAVNDFDFHTLFSHATGKPSEFFVSSCVDCAGWDR